MIHFRRTTFTAAAAGLSVLVALAAAGSPPRLA